MCLPAGKGFSQDLSALLDVKRAIPNWNLYQQRSTCFGWHETPYDNVCQWTSVKCRGGVVVALQLQTNASFHLGETAATAASHRRHLTEAAKVSDVPVDTETSPS